MSRITGDFAAMLARVWHRMTLQPDDADTLAKMLAPMDEAGEAVATEVQFDMEPSDFDAAVDELAPSEDRS